MQEVWKDVPDYEGLYQVSNLGRVKSLSRYLNTGFGSKRKTKEKILKPSGKVYFHVELCKGRVNKIFSVHRLVAQAFIPNPDNLPEIDHIDTDRKNNIVTNLRWVTHSENCRNEITKQTKSKIFTNNKKTSFPVLQLDLDGCILNEYPSIREAERQTKIEQIDIRRVCYGLNGRKTAGGYKWRLKYESK